MKVKVSRRKWTRGGLFDTGLLVEKGELGEGRMCCLGFACLQMGVRRKVLTGLAMPDDILLADETTYNGVEATEKEKQLVRKSALIAKNGKKNSKLTERAAAINDNDYMPDAVREKKLKTLFRKFGHTITFVP